MPGKCARSPKAARRSVAWRKIAKALEGLETRQLLAAHIVGSSTVYSTIQAAVDAAANNATITVDAGTYSEEVIITKPLTLKGAQAGNDARSNLRGSGETILNGIDLGAGVRSDSFKVFASNVTIDGFNITGETNTSDTVGGGIVITSAVNGTKILNNIIENNAAGVLAANNSTTNPLLIQHNLFRFNNNAGPYTGNAIVTNGTISGGNITNVTIDGNFFFKNYGTTNLEPAVAFETQATSGQSNIRITNNMFDNDGKAVLMYNASGVTITGNVVTTCRDITSGGLRFEGGMSNVTIQNNEIYASEARGIRIDNKVSAADNTAFTVTNNNFFGNGQGNTTLDALLVNAGQFAGTITATNNWWGASSGPSGEGPGTGDGVFLNGASGSFTPFATGRVFEGQFPYYGLGQDVTGRIEAENPDYGADGVSYHDSDSVNGPGRLHPYWGIDVDQSTDTDASTGYMLTNTQAGEWVEYSITVPASGTYSFNARVASGSSGGAFHLEVDGTNISGAVAMINTGGSGTWGTLTKTGLNLSAGTHILRLAFDTNTGAGNLGNWNWFGFTATSVSQPPAAPTGLAASATSATQIDLSWSNVTNETGYKIERSPDGATGWTQVATTGADVVTYSDKTVVSSTQYFYRVRATNAGGDSGYSNTANATTPAPGSSVWVSDLAWVGTPTNGWGPVEKDTSNGSSGAGDGNIITLNGVTYAKGLGAHANSSITYNLGGAYSTFISDVGNDDETGAGSIVFQVFADGAKIYDSGTMGQTTATKTINVSVAGVNTLQLVVTDAGDGNAFDHADWAGAKLTLAGGSVPAAPTGLTATPSSATQINLSWTDVASETGYKIERSTDGVNFTQVGTTAANVTTYNDTTVSGTTMYTYRVKATNANGDSPPSNTASAQPLQPPAAPTGLAATAASATQINLTWTDVAGETGYKIERSANGTTGWTQIGTTLAGVVTFSDIAAPSGTQSFYRVKATNAAGDSAPSATANATTVPAAPAGLSASAIAPTQINLAWGDVTGETGFKIERSLNGTSGWTQIGTTAANVVTYSDTTVSASTQYFYRVRASDSAGDSAYSNTANATTPAVATAPAAPSNLVATAQASGTQINLTWTDNSSNETGFKLERSLDGVTGWTQIATPAQNATSYSDTGRTPGTQYFYRILATNAVGDSAYSNTANATTPSVPAAPASLAASATSSTQINLTWSDVATETGYKIERSLDGATGWTQIGTTAANVVSYSDSTGLSAGTQYFYRVRATNAVGDGGYSNIANATTQAAPTSVYLSDLNWVGTPTNGWGPVEKDTSNGSSGAGDGHVITLNSVTYAKGLGAHANSSITYNLAGAYQTFISDVGNDDETGPGTIVFQVFADGVKIYDSGTMTQTSVTKTINVSVAGVNALQLVVTDAGDGNSYDHADWAGARLIAATVSPPAAPSSLSAAAAGTNQINLSWSDVASETGYKVERSTDGVTFAQIGTTGANVVTYSDTTGLSSGTKYYYRVRATNSGGDSGYSNIANATTTVPTPPAAPSNLVATAAGTNQINLTWSDNSSDETNFIIERSLDGATGWTQIAAPAANATGYTDSTGLSGGTEYFYRVRATNGAGDSANSNVASATTDVPTAPLAPGNLVATAASFSQINLTWADNSNNETGFIIERSLDGATGWTQVATPAANATSYSDTGLSENTQYFYRVRATNAVGDSADSNVANATTPFNTALPAGWSQGDVGTVGLTGSGTYVQGLFTVKGAGSDIAGRNDSLHYVYTTLSGNGQIVARVAGVQNTNAAAKAGVMIRDTLAANSIMASLVVTPGSGIQFIRRTSKNAVATSTTASGFAAPYWVKLIRNGTTITAYRSPDGTTWTQVGSATITMGTTIFVGLAVTSKSTSVLNTSTFDNVLVSNSTAVNPPKSPAFFSSSTSSTATASTTNKDLLALLA